MGCIKCKKELPEGAVFCPFCGKKQTPTERKATKRSNGQGSVYKRPNGTWMAAKVFGYRPNEKGVRTPIKVTKSGFKTKKEALEYLPQMKIRENHSIDPRATLKDIFDLWFPTHERKGKSKSTLAGYRSAFKHYWPLWEIPLCEISIDDLQECIDDCAKSKRTRQMMKVVGTLLYSYAIPRGYVTTNQAHYLFVGGEAGSRREEFTAKEIERVMESIGKVAYADYIYCQIYLGFRPHEFLTLDVKNYNAEEQYVIGGGKTKAGTNRMVTISPKIRPIMERLIGDRREGVIFSNDKGNQIPDKVYREDYFAVALKEMGLPFDGPNGEKRKLTPHCCRHTFATLMKAVEAPDADKLELMGHTSVDMLRHYQHTSPEDLRKITDNL